jgi:hypothetical protein
LNQRLCAINRRSDFPGGARVPANGARVQSVGDAMPTIGVRTRTSWIWFIRFSLESSVQVLARPMLLIIHA